MINSKYDMHIIFHACFLRFAFKSIIDDKDYTAQSVFVRTINSLYVSINHYHQHVLRFYIISYLRNAFVFCMLKQDIFLKSCAYFDSISLIRSYVLYTYIQRFVIKNSINKTPVIWPCYILYSENSHQLFRYKLLKVSKIS